MYPTLSYSGSTTASTSRSGVSLDSRDRDSPLYTLDYQVPVHSLEHSIAILRQAHPSRKAKSTTASQASSIRTSLSRFSSRLTSSTPSSSRSSSPSRPSKTKTDISHLLIANSYKVPVYDLEDSVKILRQPRNGRQ